jgi:uncharacterized protein (TIGR03437 family)
MKALVVMALLCGCSANDDIPSPLISTIVPDHAPPESLVTVSGSYFCQRPDTGNDDPTCDITGTVTFGQAPATPTDYSDTAITVEVPQGITGSVDVTVQAAGRSSNSVSFTAD